MQHRGVGTIVGKQVPKGTEQRFGVMVVDNETKQAIHYVEKVSSIHPICDLKLRTVELTMVLLLVST